MHPIIQAEVDEIMNSEPMKRLCDIELIAIVTGRADQYYGEKLPDVLSSALKRAIEKAGRETRRELIDFVEHDCLCVLNTFEVGESTKNGGYRQKFGGKWYESRPVDKTPKCDCGLDNALSKLDTIINFKE